MLQRYSCTLVNKQEVAPNVLQVIFELPQNASFPFIAGQYILLLIPSSSGTVRRCYSIASSPADKTRFELLLHLVPGGVASNYIQNAKKGAVFEFEGPAGMFFIRNSPLPKVFCVTGTGIAPIRSYLLSPPFSAPIHLIWGVCSIKDLYLEKELAHIQNTSKLFRFTVCLSREQTFAENYYHGRVTNLLRDILQNKAGLGSEYYICGSKEMVLDSKQLLLEKGLEKNRIFTEIY